MKNLIMRAVNRIDWTYSDVDFYTVIFLLAIVGCEVAAIGRALSGL